MYRLDEAHFIFDNALQELLSEEAHINFFCNNTNDDLNNINKTAMNNTSVKRKGKLNKKVKTVNLPVN